MEEKKQPRVKILVACHKADPNIRQDDIYMPIQVGKALHPELDLGFQCDNTGDNISEKNGSYCELTALYWAWKNLKDVDYIGLAHYRRYLDIKFDRIDHLKKNSIILAYPEYTSYSNFIHLTDGTTREDVYILFKYLEKYYPQYCKYAIDYLFNYNGWIGCNLFLCERELFENYCSWLFSVLRQLEKYLKPSGYARLKRIYGYLGEVMLPIYCRANGISINFAPISDTRKNPLRYYLKKFYYKLAFKFSNPKSIKELKVPQSTAVSMINDGIVI